jgi:hypothetical protein
MLMAEVEELFPPQAAKTAAPRAMADGLRKLNMLISLLPQKRNSDRRSRSVCFVVSRVPAR